MVLYVRSEIMLNALSEEGIYVSSGSACAKGAKGSSTLAAMNVPFPDNAIRFSFSKHTTAEELEETYQTIIKKLEAPSDLSTLWRNTPQR